MTKKLLLSLILFLSLSSFAGIEKSSDTINRLNPQGKREGWWVLTSDNDPIHDGKGIKAKEGRYINGRKNGVWITYYEDGKTPRLIGEYGDNRPSGTYFRFDRKGELQQASAVPRRIPVKQFLQVSNSIFSCRMLFNQRDLVAGQVFFSKRLFAKNPSIQFWMETSMNTTRSESVHVDYTWLNSSYSRILQTYTTIRTPKKMRVSPTVAVVNNTPVVAVVKEPKRVTDARAKHYYYPPAIHQPRVGKGMVFQPNGLNKLYTENNEIWIDGHFIRGKLYTGKVFVYDHDGILLKVRVYKDGVYESDGVL